MPELKLNGKTYSGSTSYASAVEYTKKDGTKSTVQNELDELNTNMNKNTTGQMRYNSETDMVEIYHNDNWNNWKSGDIQSDKLYFYGNENTELTGGWTPYAYKTSSSSSAVSAPTVTKKEKYMKLSKTVSGSNWLFGSVFTENAIDLTDYEMLKLKVIGVQGANGGTSGSISLNITSTKSNSYSVTKSLSITSDGEYAIDISSLTGNYYVCFAVARTSGTVSCYVESVQLLK